MTTNHFRIIVLALAGVAGISAALKVRVVAGEETPAAVKTGRDWLDVPRPERVPMPAAEEIETAIRRGTDFLLERQLTHGDAHGAWGSATRTKGLNIYAPVPGAHEGFRAAVTSLCLSALIEGTDRRPEVIAAIEAGERWLLEHLGNVRRANQDAIYNVWAHAYAIEALADLHGYRHDDPDKQAQLRQMIVGQIDRLDRYESVDGGWGYYDFRAYAQQPSSNPTSFTTATALIAFHDARSLGIEIPDRLVRRAIACVERQQKPDFSYYYSDNGPVDNQPMRSINRPGGSLGRSQACNLALRLWDRPEITDRVLDAWLARLFSRNLWLDIGRKRPIPHESHFLVAGYFFYYGHYHAARCIELLPADEQQQHSEHLCSILLRLQEEDGSWWDYPLYDYHQQYGTAFSLMALQRLREAGR